MSHTKQKLLLRYLIPFVCVCISVKVSAQDILVPEDSLPATDFVYHQTDDYKAFLKNIADNNAAPLDKKIQKQYLKVIEDKNSDLIDRLNKNEFIFDPVIYPYLYSIFLRAVKSNGLDPNTFHFFVSRSYEANAYTYEDGTIVCNLGLLNIIRDESQLEMVFCHELSHFLLKHSNTALIKQLETLNSDELLEQLKDIQKEQYNTKEQLEKIMLTDVFNRRKHNRAQETAADSLGMILFCKTGYGSNSVPQLFDLFDSCETNDTPLRTMKDFFTAEGLPSDDNWFKARRKMSFGEAPAKEIVDSLRTHPNCTMRKQATLAYFDQHSATGPCFSIGDINTLQQIKNIAFFDEATYIKDNNNLGLYLYDLIQNDAQFPGNNYIKTEIFNTMLSLCMHQHEHTFYKVVNQPYVPDNDKDEYAKLLKILDEVGLRDLISITIAYYEKNEVYIHPSNESITNLNQLKTI
jgi:hypothetical protein